MRECMTSTTVIINILILMNVADDVVSNSNQHEESGESAIHEFHIFFTIMQFITIALLYHYHDDLDAGGIHVSDY
jgi:hypothetical protein